jgi:hypothetical protein
MAFLVVHDIDRLVAKAFPFTPQRSIASCKAWSSDLFNARSRCFWGPNLHHEGLYSN